MAPRSSAFGQHGDGEEERGQDAITDAQRFRAGDSELFAHLHRRLSPKFQAYLAHAIERADDVDDALQETWVRAFERRMTFEGRSSLDTWLWTVCRHTCASWKRNQQRHKSRQMTLSSLRFEPILERSVEAENAFAVVHGRTESALLALSRRQFEVACYRWIAGYSTAQTAGLMHVSQGTVKATLHQAPKKILIQVAALSELGEEGFQPPGRPVPFP